eukprot:Hpha_TRINITY_DN30287_c0_g1::TRINITY_DN30287_c0_g1_i1::g.27161::m.27161
MAFNLLQSAGDTTFQVRGWGRANAGIREEEAAARAEPGTSQAGMCVAGKSNATMEASMNDIKMHTGEKAGRTGDCVNHSCRTASAPTSAPSPLCQLLRHHRAAIEHITNKATPDTTASPQAPLRSMGESESSIVASCPTTTSHLQLLCDTVKRVTNASTARTPVQTPHSIENRIHACIAPTLDPANQPETKSIPTSANTSPTWPWMPLGSCNRVVVQTSFPWSHLDNTTAAQKPVASTRNTPAATQSDHVGGRSPGEHDSTVYSSALAPFASPRRSHGHAPGDRRRSGFFFPFRPPHHMSPIQSAKTAWDGRGVAGGGGVTTIRGGGGGGASRKPPPSQSYIFNPSPPSRGKGGMRKSIKYRN